MLGYECPQLPQHRATHSKGEAARKRRSPDREPLLWALAALAGRSSGEAMRLGSGLNRPLSDSRSIMGHSKLLSRWACGGWSRTCM